MKLVSIPANPVPDNFVAGELKTPDGVSLRFARWLPPAGRKGTVVILQGRGEWIEKYFETVRDLRSRGFAVAALDWRGQGLSERMLSDRHKGYVRDFAEYDSDLETFMREIVMPDCPPPLFALGHSTGATVLIRAAYRGRRWFDRMVLAAPLIDLQGFPATTTAKVLVRALRIAGFGSMYVPRGDVGVMEAKPFVGNILTSDPVRYARNQAVLEAAPELALGPPTVAWTDAAFRTMRTHARAQLPGAYPPADPDHRRRQRRRGVECGDRGFRHAFARRLASRRGRRPARIADGAGPLPRPVLGGVRCVRSRHGAVLKAVSQDYLAAESMAANSDVSLTGFAR